MKTNEEKILKLLLKKPLTAAQLASLIGCKKVTVYRAVRRLVDQQLVWKDRTIKASDRGPYAAVWAA